VTPSAATSGSIPEPPEASSGSAPRWLALAVAWVACWLAATVVAAGTVVDVPGVGGQEARYGSALVTVLLAVALARRCGGLVWFWGLLATAAVALVLIGEQRWLDSSAAVLVAVVGGVTSVLLTRPATTYVRLVMEYAIALSLAGSAALAVAGYGAEVSAGRYYLLVVVLSVTSVMAVIWRLGADVHRLGVRGVLGFAAGAVVIAALLVYSRLLLEYGSPSVTGAEQDVTEWIRNRLDGVPRPIEALVGFPALLVGLRTRAQRRQGWWMCAIGTFGTATVATTLAAPGTDVGEAARSLAYSVALGLLVGFLILAVQAVLTRRRAAARGRRARDVRPLAASRPEPGRTRPLG
jgi:hypothetical protein